MQFQKASRDQIKARMGIVGPPGSGKTTTALATMKHLATRTAVIDSERGSSSRYAGLFDFDVLDLQDFHPQSYMQAIAIAVEAGYDGLIIDSFSHAWYSALDLVNASKTDLLGWTQVRPLLRKLNDQMLRAPCHIIATMRSKTAWDMRKVNGKTIPYAKGVGTVQSKDIEYEFDIFGELRDRTLYITKSRCPELQGRIFVSPGENVAEIIRDWIAGEPSPYQICQTWKKPEDAINWASLQLFHFPPEDLRVLFEKLEPDQQGKKRPWVDLISKMKEEILKEVSEQ